MRWNRLHPRCRMRRGRELERGRELSALCGDGREGSDWRGLELNLDLSAIAREGAWRLRLQTKGQRKNGAARSGRPCVLRILGSSKLRGTKSLELATRETLGEKWMFDCVPENCRTFRIERGCQGAFPNWEWRAFTQVVTVGAPAACRHALSAPSRLRVNRMSALP